MDRREIALRAEAILYDEWGAASRALEVREVHEVTTVRLTAVHPESRHQDAWFEPASETVSIGSPRAIRCLAAAHVDGELVAEGTDRGRLPSVPAEALVRIDRAARRIRGEHADVVDLRIAVHRETVARCSTGEGAFVWVALRARKVLWACDPMMSGTRRGEWVARGFVVLMVTGLVALPVLIEWGALGWLWLPPLLLMAAAGLRWLYAWRHMLPPLPG